MKFSLSLILELLNRLLDAWDRYKTRKREERIQDAYDEYSEDPDAWFDSEFGRMPDESETSPSDTSSKTPSNSE